MAVLEQTQGSGHRRLTWMQRFQAARTDDLEAGYALCLDVTGLAGLPARIRYQKGHSGTADGERAYSSAVCASCRMMARGAINELSGR